MDGTLTVSSKLSPFPFAAIAIASYTQKAALNFDETATGITLDLNGSSITSEDQIVHALAKAADLAGDSAKVSPSYCIRSPNNIDFS
jgi:glutamyl-tRNA synthetase